MLHTTARHPFWSQTRQQWVRADQLNTSDRLGTDKTGRVRVAHVTAIPGDQVRWDLTITTDHDYYVLAGHTPVLVHNCGEAAASTGTKGGVYTLRDEVGNVVRTGRTKDLGARESAHFNDPVLGDYQFNVEHRTDVYAEQRGLEQMLYDRYPGAQAVNGGFNKIRGISRPTLISTSICNQPETSSDG